MVNKKASTAMQRKAVPRAAAMKQKKREPLRVTAFLQQRVRSPSVRPLLASVVGDVSAFRFPANKHHVVASAPGRLPTLAARRHADLPPSARQVPTLPGRLPTFSRPRFPDGGAAPPLPSRPPPSSLPPTRGCAATTTTPFQCVHCVAPGMPPIVDGDGGGDESTDSEGGGFPWRTAAPPTQPPPPLFLLDAKDVGDDDDDETWRTFLL